MRVAVVNVGLNGFHRPASNMARLGVLEDLVGQASEAACDLILLPGGFLTVVGETAVAGALTPLRAALDGHGVSVVAGVDLAPPDAGWPTDAAYWTERVASGTLPSFAVTWTPASSFGAWRQRCITAEHEGAMPSSLEQEVRRIRVADQDVGVLVCGEMFNETIRCAYIASGLQIVTDSGHIGRGWRAFRGLSRLTARPDGIGEAVACAHVRHAPGRQYRYSAGSPAGARRWDLWVDGPPWAAGAVFTL